MKTCRRCSQEKPLAEFHKETRSSDGVKPYCKNCIKKEGEKYRKKNKEEIKIKKKQYYLKNKESINNRKKQHYQDNKEQILKKNKQYRQDNKEQIKKQKKEYQRNNKEYLKEYLREYYSGNKQRLKTKSKQYYLDNKEKVKQYRQDNKEYLNEYNVQYVKQRCANEPLYRFKRNLRNLVSNSIKRQGYSKKSKSFEILGCSFEHLMNWLDFEKWNNEDCHIDHIIPISLAKNEDDALLLSHYTNLQILSAEDNIKKGNRKVKFENLIKVVNNHPEPKKITKILNNSNINLL